MARRNEKRCVRKPPRVAGDATDPRGMMRLASQFIEWLEVHGYSADTVRSRRTALSWFILWCAERGVTRPTDVTRAVLERYQRWLFNYRKKDGLPLSLAHQHHRLMALRMFFRWLARNHHLLFNPAAELELPRVEKRLPKTVLTAPEMEQIINAADIGAPLGIRDRAMMETLYSTGVRRSELVWLQLHDVDMERGTVMVRQGKGKRDRMVPIGDRALVWIEKYLVEVRPSLVVEPDEGTIFLTNMGDTFTPKRLSQLVSRYVDAAGFAKRGSCHLFRHACATLMLEAGADTRFIQELLGHQKLETTQIYTQVSITKLKEVHTATHPAKLTRDEGRSVKDESTAAVAETIGNRQLEIGNGRLLSSLAAEAAEEEEA